VEIELAGQLVAILAAFASAQIVITRWLIRRSDRQMEQSDKHLSRLIKGLTDAVEAFRKFEVDEKEVHTRMVDTQKRILEAAKGCAEAQREILLLLERIKAKVDLIHHVNDRKTS
jgi:septal ring factor EnvC (AmiA/AmiB activator)